jgi:hypothetical protein
MLPVPPARAAPVLELYGTFHAMGVIATVEVGDDPDEDAIASVEYRASGSGEPYRQGYPLSRVSSTRFAGSLFWLEPGTTYDVRVSFSDTDGALNGVVLSASGATRNENTIPEAINSFYVSPNGSGTACSLASPCALVEGLDQAMPGDELVLYDGVYYEGEFYPPRSGTKGAPIVIRGFPGESVVLDGADPATFTWTGEGGGVYHTSVNVGDPHLVLAGGDRLYPYHSLADLQNLIWDLPGFYAAGTDLFVHLEGNADPSNATMIISRFHYAFQVGQDWIYFLDLTFRHYGQGTGARAIKFNNANDNLVQGCTFAVNDMGVVIGYDAERNVIQDNEFFDTIFAWPWAAVKDSSGLEAGGIRFNYPTTPRGTVIRRNIFHDLFDGFNACPSETAGATNETDVYENLVYRVVDDGMQADGECTNVRIWGNVFRDGKSGISLAPAYTGPTYAIRNLIYRTDITPFKFNFSGDQSGPMYLFHNTCDAVQADTAGLWIGYPGAWKLIYARNNIWAGTGYALKNRNLGQPVSLDYDELWNGNSGDLVSWGDTDYATLVGFTTSTDQESHGVSVVPGFADAPTGDYSLDPSSSLIDAGVVIPGINDDFVGLAPDIGAFEYETYGFCLAVVPPGHAIDPGESATFSIEVRPTGGFSDMVSLVAASPSPSLTVSLSPETLLPPGQATLAVTDLHEGMLLPGLSYAVPITATASDITQVVSAYVLVRGTIHHLPIVLRR